MPVVQQTMNRGKQKYSIAYAFQPGDNGVRLSYEVPYSGKGTLRFASPLSIQRVMLVAPPTMQVSSPGFTSAGTEQGFNLYARDAVPAGLPFEVTLSGTAPMPAGNQQGSQGGGGDADAGGQAPDAINGRDTGPALQTLPNRLDNLKWILLAGFAGTALATLGLLFIPWALLTAGLGRVVWIRSVEMTLFWLSVSFLFLIFGRWALALLLTYYG